MPGIGSLPPALAGERALLIPVFRLSWNEMQDLNPEGGRAPPRQNHPAYSGKPAFFVWRAGLSERELAFDLATMEKSVALASLPRPENLALTNYLETAGQLAPKRLLFLSSLLLPPVTLADM